MNEKGMCSALSNKDFYYLMTTDSTGRTNNNLVKMILRYYPELLPLSYEN